MQQRQPGQKTDIVVTLDQANDTQAWKRLAASKLGVEPEAITSIRKIKESIDARRYPVKLQMRVEVGIGHELEEAEACVARYPEVSAGARRVVIVGSGPAGMFAALRCLEYGLKPVVLERGKDASARRFDLAPIMRHGTVIEDSNYCFGEGGAGTFSDGKLYTRATKRGPVHKVYRTFVAHGAPVEILTDAHPHIGSNLLPNVVKAMRQSILAAGGEVHFQTRAAGLIRDAAGRAIGVTAADGREFRGDAVILATGHSARDVYRMLLAEGVNLEQKPFAVGVRIEHDQATIDRIQYHLKPGTERHRALPAARYALATKIADRGVHSFCMCPGGFIVPAATENDEVVVNGMSLARRDSPYANSGLVVTVEPEDTRKFAAEHGVLAGIAYQKAMEVTASRAGGGMQKAPGQRVTDFLRAQLSKDLPATSYHPGITPAELHKLMPADVVWRMQQGLELFGRKMRGYLSPEVKLIGFETRTSSPVRIPRDSETLQNPDAPGLYPAGEGAGFAGGIVSAALDGLRCVEAIARAWSLESRELD